MDTGVEIKADPMIGIIANACAASGVLSKRVYKLMLEDNAVVYQSVNGALVAHATDDLLDTYYWFKGVQ